MKNQIYGSSQTEKKWYTPVLAAVSLDSPSSRNDLKVRAFDNYVNNRQNGTRLDSPPYELPSNGEFTCEVIQEANTKGTYTEGTKDKKWMEEKDRNYVFRLEREGRLDEAEPNLKTEVPKLYAEIMGIRQAKAEKERKKLEAQKKEQEEKQRKDQEQKERAEKEKAEKERKELEVQKKEQERKEEALKKKAEELHQKKQEQQRQREREEQERREQALREQKEKDEQKQEQLKQQTERQEQQLKQQTEKQTAQQKEQSQTNQQILQSIEALSETLTRQLQKMAQTVAQNSEQLSQAQLQVQEVRGHIDQVQQFQQIQQLKEKEEKEREEFDRKTRESLERIREREQREEAEKQEKTKDKEEKEKQVKVLEKDLEHDQISLPIQHIQHIQRFQQLKEKDMKAQFLLNKLTIGDKATITLWLNSFDLEGLCVIGASVEKGDALLIARLKNAGVIFTFQALEVAIVKYLKSCEQSGEDLFQEEMPSLERLERLIEGVKDFYRLYHSSDRSIQEKILLIPGLQERAQGLLEHYFERNGGQGRQEFQEEINEIKDINKKIDQQEREEREQREKDRWLQPRSSDEDSTVKVQMDNLDINVLASLKERAFLHDTKSSQIASWVKTKKAGILLDYFLQHHIEQQGERFNTIITNGTTFIGRLTNKLAVKIVEKNDNGALSREKNELFKVFASKQQKNEQAIRDKLGRGITAQETEQAKMEAARKIVEEWRTKQARSFDEYLKKILEEHLLKNWSDAESVDQGLLTQEVVKMLLTAFRKEELEESLASEVKDTALAKIEEVHAKMEETRQTTGELNDSELVIKTWVDQKLTKEDSRKKIDQLITEHLGKLLTELMDYHPMQLRPRFNRLKESMRGIRGREHVESSASDNERENRRSHFTSVGLFQVTREQERTDETDDLSTKPRRRRRQF